jgi:hypothetical protein
MDCHDRQLGREKTMSNLKAILIFLIVFGAGFAFAQIRQINQEYRKDQPKVMALEKPTDQRGPSQTLPKKQSKCGPHPEREKWSPKQHLSYLQHDVDELCNYSGYLFRQILRVEKRIMEEGRIAEKKIRALEDRLRKYERAADKDISHIRQTIANFPGQIGDNSNLIGALSKDVRSLQQWKYQLTGKP